jgi:hypothetical protein
VIVDGGAHLDLLDLDDLLLLAGLGGLFLLFVFVFAVIHQFADGRLVVWRYLDHVEAFFLAQRQGFIQPDLAVFVAIVTDQENSFGGDFVIDARAVLGGGFFGRAETSNDYDSLLCLRPMPDRQTATCREGSSGLAKHVAIKRRG